MRTQRAAKSSAGSLLPVGVQLRVAAQLARRPHLWAVATRTLWAMRAPRWWAVAPFLPLPPADYAAFRIQTMYGGEGTLPASAAGEAPGQLVGWLEWVRTQQRR